MTFKGGHICLCIYSTNLIFSQHTSRIFGPTWGDLKLKSRNVDVSWPKKYSLFRLS